MEVRFQLNGNIMDKVLGFLDEWNHGRSKYSSNRHIQLSVAMDTQSHKYPNPSHGARIRSIIRCGQTTTIVW